jgi:hypothetical protein
LIQWKNQLKKPESAESKSNGNRGKLEIKDVEDNPLLQSASGGTFGTLVQSISENQKLGRFIESPPLELALFAWSMVHGMSTLYLNNNFKGPLNIALTDPGHYIQRLAQLTEAGLMKKN